MDDAENLKAKAGQLQLALLGAWKLLTERLHERRAELVNALVNANSDETRGRIKQIDEFLGLPEALSQEARPMVQQEDEITL